MKTKVIFRKFPDGEVIAIFPRDAGSINLQTCLSYMHTGQHGACDPVLLARSLPLAKPSEYRELARELRRIGYRLEVRRRCTWDDRREREREINGCA